MMGEKFHWGSHVVTDSETFLAGWDTYQNLSEAEAYCTTIARAHYENFIISNQFTPPEIRQHIQNIYAFCRYSDDLGDEAPFDPEGRTKLLQTWLSDLHTAYGNDWQGQPRHPILIALAHTSRTFNIPIEPYERLITAFLLDQKKFRYDNWEELKHYCVHSADPVGHLFLYVYGHDDAKMRLISDFTCTALQLANHWQDIARDSEQGRRYVPLDTMKKHGYSEQDFENKIFDERWQSILKEEVDRAQELFDKGKELWSLVDPHLAVDLEMFTLGGEEILKSIRKQKYNTWKRRPKVSKFRQMLLLIKSKRKWKKVSKRPSL